MAAAIIRDAGLERYYEDRSEYAPRPGPLRAGWDAVPVTLCDDGTSEVRLVLDGLRCASCVWVTEHILQATPGVAGSDRQLCHRTGQPSLGSRGRGSRHAGRQGGRTWLPAPSPWRREPAGPGPRDPARCRHVRRHEHHDDVGGPLPGLGVRHGRALRGAVPMGLAAARDSRGPVVRRAVLLGSHPGSEEPRPAHGPPDRAGGGRSVRARPRIDDRGDGHLLRFARHARRPAARRPHARGSWAPPGSGGRSLTGGRASGHGPQAGCETRWRSSRPATSSSAT